MSRLNGEKLRAGCAQQYFHREMEYNTSTDGFSGYRTPRMEDARKRRIRTFQGASIRANRQPWDTWVSKKMDEPSWYRRNAYFISRRLRYNGSVRVRRQGESLAIERAEEEEEEQKRVSVQRIENQGEETMGIRCLVSRRNFYLLRTASWNSRT